MNSLNCVALPNCQDAQGKGHLTIVVIRFNGARI